MKLIFATNNHHKVEEIRAALPKSFEITTLKEGGIDIDIPEPFDTLQENAATKAETIFGLTQTNCFSEDTGLEVYALNNEPGVKSARYAGEDRAFEKNIEKLLQKLQGVKDRKARFRTVICLILEGRQHYFEGICEGFINHTPSGQGGFGYDAVFTPDNASKTFAEMSLEEKNSYSHRKKAVDKLVTFLNQLI